MVLPVTATPNSPEIPHRKDLTKNPPFSTFPHFLLKKFRPIHPPPRICRDRGRDVQIPLLPFRILSIPFLFSLLNYVLANDHSSAKDGGKTKKDDGRRSPSMGIKIIIICLGVVTVIAFSVILFKIWQKKKREEQHARLLKLFEDDDELEVELGLRD
ncbi:unnamed protein product [Citrullus colocynthis]|uniref:Transmembrane protein n=1 Tax=Citrullus colocynthis TaxID=252529 RepID=A0ABP0Y0Q8_9ROSI